LLVEASREQLEAKLGYQFQNRELLQRALTHRSWLEGRAPSEGVHQDNEQLEYLGDSILGFVVSETLVLRHPSSREGQLSRWKAHLVSASHLHQCAVDLGLGEFLLLGRGEERNGGRERRALLADATEAVIAAIYLDGGMEPTRGFIRSHILDSVSDLEELSLSNNQKVELQHQARLKNLPMPRYSVISESGPDHAKQFVVEARINDELVTHAEAGTKKLAALLAAKSLLELLGNEATE
jgi:ribonuclease III